MCWPIFEDCTVSPMAVQFVNTLFAVFIETQHQRLLSPSDDTIQIKKKELR